MSYQPKVYRDNGGDRQVLASEGVIKIEAGGKLLDEQSAGSSQPALVFQHDITVPNGGAGTTVSLAVADKIEIIDVLAHNTGVGSSGSTAAATVQLKTSTGGAISNAIDIKKPKDTITRAATIASALKTIAAGASIKAVRASTAATTAISTALVLRVFALKRS